MDNKQMTANDLRQQFIRDNAQEILDEYAHKRKTNEWLNPDGCPLIRERMWNMIKTMIMDAADLQITQLASADNVLKELAKGRISDAQAGRILDLLQKKQQIEELPQLLQQLEQLQQQQSQTNLLP